jgi:hypothetical protein
MLTVIHVNVRNSMNSKVRRRPVGTTPRSSSFRLPQSPSLEGARGRADERRLRRDHLARHSSPLTDARSVVGLSEGNL